MKLGPRIRLKSFLGMTSAPDGILGHENYWRLIGMSGSVVQDVIPPNFGGSEGDRILVKFDQSISELGLECHNNVENSLWIMASDLEFDEAENQSS